MFDMNIFKRNVKLQELGIDKLPNREQEILNFLNENLSNLNTYQLDGYPNKIYYGKNNENIVLYFRDSKYLYVSYHKIWDRMAHKINISYMNVQKIIHWYVVDKLNLDVDITNTHSDFIIVDIQKLKHIKF